MQSAWRLSALSPGPSPNHWGRGERRVDECPLTGAQRAKVNAHGAEPPVYRERTPLNRAAGGADPGARAAHWNGVAPGSGRGAGSGIAMHQGKPAANRPSGVAVTTEVGCLPGG